MRNQDHRADGATSKVAESNLGIKTTKAGGGKLFDVVGFNTY